MEFKVFQKEIELQSRGWIPTFHDVTSDILKIVEENGEEVLVTIDDDDEFDRVADAFDNEMMEEYDLDAVEEKEEK